MRPRKTPKPGTLADWEKPLNGCENLWWTDDFGNRWDNNPSEEIFKVRYGSKRGRCDVNETPKHKRFETCLSTKMN